MFHIRITVYTTFLALLSFFAFRILLFLTNLDQLEDAGALTVMHAFLIGLRFDLVVICYLLAIPFLLLSLAYFWNGARRIALPFVRILLSVVFPIIFIMSSVDIPFFNHFFSRLDISVFQWWDEPAYMFHMITGEVSYWIYTIPFLLIAVTFVIGIGKIFKNSISGAGQYKHIVPAIALSVIIAASIFLGIRGRMSTKSPIRTGTAYFSDNPFLNKMGLNPGFTLMRSYLDSRLPENQGIQFTDDASALRFVRKEFGLPADSAYLRVERKISPDRISQNRYNIVLVIMESMSAGKMSRFGNENDLTPFLDSISDYGYSFDRTYTSGRHTYNGLFSTLFSYPALFLQHPMKRTEMPEYYGLPHALKSNGYNTVFFTTHDAQFDNMEGFLINNEMDEVISLEDYPDDKSLSSLGIADDYMFEFSIPYLNELHRKGSPFLSVFLTSSDHGPYIVPDYFHSGQSDIELQIVQYADWSLKKLVELSANQPWFDSTLFVFIADHGSYVKTVYTIPLSYHHSPFIIYNPSIIKDAVKYDCLAGQIDLFPTIMHLLNLPYTNRTLGIDLFAEKRKYIYFCADEMYGVLSDEYYLIVKPDGIYGLYKYENRETVDYQKQFPDRVSAMQSYAENMMQAAQYLMRKRH